MNPQTTAYQFCVDADYFKGDGSRVNPLSINAAGVLGSSLIAGSVGAMPAGVNLSTEGTIDWVYQTSADRVWMSTVATDQLVRSKRNGGALRRNRPWWSDAVSTTQNLTDTPCTFTSIASDDTFGNAASFTTRSGFTNNLGVVGMGFGLQLPVLPSQQVLRIYTGQFNNVVQLDAWFDDGSVAPLQLTNAVTQDNSFKQWAVTFRGPRGATMFLTMRVTARSAAAPIPDNNFAASAFTLAAA